MDDLEACVRILAAGLRAYGQARGLASSPATAAVTPRSGW
jgi:hypothetical protein